MCGIAGSVRFSGARESALLGAMVASMRHRGPDDEGTAEFPEDGVSLGMTRLSILDIEGGHQPMSDEAGRYWLIYNGEIYNYRDLWDELVGLGHRFTSDHSDTEVIVHGFEEWGPELFKRLNGMFAIAIWDNVERRLTLARDRVGEKPIYLGRLDNGGWVFGSELKALLLHPDLDRALDPLAIEQFLAFDFVVGPRTVLKAVEKVPAGHYVSLTASARVMEPYWRPSFRREAMADGEMLQRLDALLEDSVRLRMVADVPVGLFLSGGLDSTTIGYYMARETAHVRSFSIGFDDPRFDESAEARLAADHLGISNDLHVFSEVEVRELVPRVTELLDEPMGDQSVFPTYLLSLVAREHVKVALGGDGSDELFMGYRTYQVLKLSWALDGLPLAGAARSAGGFLPAYGPHSLGRLRTFAMGLALDPEARLLARLGSFHGTSRWALSETLRESLPPSIYEGPTDEIDRYLSADLDSADRTVGTYLRGYLQEDILVKIDRASMAASLEVRSPFLDPRIVDFALTLPPAVRMPRMRRKDPLRRLMRGRIPDQLIDRPKRGFGVPLSAWLRSGLSALVDDYLAPARLARVGIFDAASVEFIVERHRAGSDLAGNQVWLLLLFEMWRDRWIDGYPPVAS